MYEKPTPENFERLVLEELGERVRSSEEEELLVKSFSNEGSPMAEYVSRWKKEYTFHISEYIDNHPSSAIGRFEVEYYAKKIRAQEDFDAQLAACLSAFDFTDTVARDYFLVNPRACPHVGSPERLSQGEEEDKGVALVKHLIFIGHDHRPKELDKIRVFQLPVESPRSFHEEFWLPRVLMATRGLEKLDFIFMHGCFQYKAAGVDEINAAATEAEMAEGIGIFYDPALDAMVGWVQDDQSKIVESLNISIGADCLYLASKATNTAVRIVEGTPSHDHGHLRQEDSQEAVGFLTWLLQCSCENTLDAFYIAGDLFDDSRLLHKRVPTWHIVDVIREVLITKPPKKPEGVKRLLNTNDIQLRCKPQLKRSQS
ncbi:hypothetical protein SPFM1_00279 [Salmonella phage SPFM1]|nr:hypothetical protein SPFM1_00279 [Salmonella phage SPFM1]